VSGTLALEADAAAIARKVAPMAAAGVEGRVNRRLIQALGEEGLLPRLFPQRAGGHREGDVSAVDLCVVRETLGRESTQAENAIAIQTLGSYPIVLAGTDTQVRRWVVPLATGKAVAAFALTEPNAGSDAGALELLAEPDGKSGDLRTDMTWVDGKGVPRAGQRFVQPVSVHEKIADVRVDLEIAGVVAEGAFEGVQRFAGKAQVAVNEANGDRAGMTRASWSARVA